MNSFNNKSFICYCLVLVSVLSCLATMTHARLLRRPIYDEYGSGLDGYGGAALPTGQRAIIKVRGARHPIDGSAPQKLTIEDDPYRGPLPRGIYDNMDNYRGRDSYPYGGSNLMHQGSYGGYGDYLQPDFGVRARLNVAGNKPSKCRFSTEADSEIPELGLDTGRLNVDCNLNPVRMANAAMRVARKYHKHRKNKKKHQMNGDTSTIRSTSKRKTTTVTIKKDVEKKKHRQEDGDDY